MPASAPILHVCAPARYGGLERVIEGLLLGLADAGEAVELVATLDPGAPLPEWAQGLAARGIPVHTLVAGGRRYDHEYRALATLFTARRAAVVHTHGYRADVIAGLAARRAGIPTVTTLHGFTRHGLKNRFFEWLQLRSAAASDAAIAVSAPLQAELAARGVPADRVTLIPNRLGPSTAPYRSRSEARAALGLAGDGVVIGWMGRLSLEKDPVAFVEAFAAMRRDGETACIVGDGPERERAERVATTLGVQAQLHFAGAIPDAGKLLAAFDLLVLSSRTEGTPMVVLEAAQAGTPVVATPVGGLPALLGSDGGWLADAADVASLATMLRRALDDLATSAQRANTLRARLGDAESAEWLARHRALYARLRERR